MNKDFNIFMLILTGLLFIFDFVYLGGILLVSYGITKMLGGVK